MLNLYDHVRQLHQAELFGDLKHLASFVLSLCDNSAEMEVMSLPQKYHCLVYFGDALYHTEEFKKAESVFRKALLLKKAINKAKGKCGVPADVISEVDVRFKLYECLLQQKQNAEALNVLESINTKQRTAKINLALAKLYRRDGRDRSAMTCYKEVVREHPLALEAGTGLLTLGMKGADVAALIMNSLPHGTSCEWLSSWIKGHAYMSSKEYSNAVQTFRHMETKTCLKDNVQLLNCVGEARFYDGQYTNAMSVFQRVHALDPFVLKNMDLYAFLLKREKKFKELQGLAQQLMGVSEAATEPWVAMGYYSLMCITKPKERAARAVYFAQKAYQIDPRSIQALILKGTALLELKKLQDATLHFLEAVRLAPHRFEAFHGLIECYLSNNKVKDAQTWATRMIRTYGNSARTLTLYASVLSKDPNLITKAKPYLEKAMKLDSTYLEPVYQMCDILTQEQQYDRGIELLQRQLETHSTGRLHQLLGDFLTQTNRIQEAMDQYNITLTMEPFNAKAREGIERLEKHNEMGMEGGYDVEVEMGGSDNDADFEGSDMESTWSETDFS